MILQGRAKGALMVLGAAAAWGLMGTLARHLFTAGEVGPLFLTVIRSTLAVLILLVGILVLNHRQLRLALKEWPLAALTHVSACDSGQHHQYDGAGGGCRRRFFVARSSLRLASASWW